ncbi:metallophosphoesterase [Hymenobacter latericus]|uniref:metallophosphoesterase n=1 Tax=Hymenobacter sp. YIM 151858-1 TaxID=2987688 RepID=UPI0022267A69|nr:metallophosphoesterase [Hymenobacter sp. YIM 151858-1]UYZ60383.1 metallophosphoesterase [Hymenobacter sp. YIM 151858-1]
MAFKPKRALLALAAAYFLYLAGGLALASQAVIDRVYFFPGFSIKRPIPDNSGFSPDGPVVQYLPDGTALSRRIVPGHLGHALQTDTLRRATDSLSCFVQETGLTFRFPRHPFPAVEPAEYPAPARMLVLSDIEGNFRGLQQLLQGAGVMDAQTRWRFGTGHLVFVGDMFDRGLQVTECLWLLYKLEHEAAQAGGKVHFILGNHEVMNLTGHHKYLRRKYRHNADSLGLDYARWYAPDTELGRWLRSKNVVERIGPTLFVHGGISPEVAALRLPLAQLNALTRRSLDAPQPAAPSPAEQLVRNPKLSPDWYRGIAQEEAPAAHVAAVLRQYSATRMVIAHTPVEKITPLYDGQVVAIDLPHQEHTKQGFMQALWVEGGKFSVVDNLGRKQAL